MLAGRTAQRAHICTRGPRPGFVVVGGDGFEGRVA
jgi:hypothetical protein